MPPSYSTTVDDEEELNSGVPLPEDANATGEDTVEPGLPYQQPPPPMGVQVPPPSPMILRGPQGPPMAPPMASVSRLAPADEARMQSAQMDTWLARQQQANVPFAQAEAAYHAALRFQGQRQYQQDLASGMAPGEALARSAPLMFSSPKANVGQAASLINAIKPKPVPVMTPYQQAEIEQNRKRAAALAAYRKAQLASKTGRLTDADKALLGADVTELKGLEKQLGSTEEHGFGVLHPFGGNKSQMDALRKRAADLRQNIQTKYGGRTTTGSIAPAPRNVKERVAGTTYQTPKGPHTWTGTGWKVAQDATLPATAAPNDTTDEEDSNGE